MNNYALEIDEVSKQYNNKLVLKELNIKIKRGESVGLVGINGAGKTTLLKCILDLNRPDSGEIKIFGENCLSAASRATLTYLPERFSAPSHLSGYDYLKFMMRLQNRPYNSEQVDAAAQSLGFPDAMLALSVISYSKGMMQKLGLMACFLADKPLLIFDEPMSGLDPLARTFLKKRIMEAKEQGHTFLVSTHMLADVASICDRMLVLHNQSIQFDGTPHEFSVEFGNEDLDQSFVNCISDSQAS